MIESNSIIKACIFKDKIFRKYYILINKPYIYTSVYTKNVDVDRNILNFLSEDILINVSNVNKYLYELCDNIFWKQQFKKKYNILLEEHELKDKTYKYWFKYYIKFN